MLAIDLHDRWVAHQREVTPPGQPLPPSPIASAASLRLNDLLGTAKPVQQLAGQANQVVGSTLGQAVRSATGSVGVLLSSAGSSASSLLDRPFSQSLETSPRASTAQDIPGLSPRQSAPGLLGRAFTRAQLLGGSIGLTDLQEGPMAPLALAERALQRSSGDPLAPLPSLWREPMRQALLRLPGAPQPFSPARTVIVPSAAVRRPVQVPLALQSDGSVDVLASPDDSAVLREIEGWSRQQRLPPRGALQPTLVHLHPLPLDAPITPAATPSRNPAEAPGPAVLSSPVVAPPLRGAAAPGSAEPPLPRPLPSPPETPPPSVLPPAPASVRLSAAGAADSSSVAP